MCGAVCLILAWLSVAGAPGAQEGIVSAELSGRAGSHTVTTGETLSAIGSRYGVEWSTLVRDNGLDAPDVLDVDQVLRIDNRHVVPPAPFDTGILINVPQRMLFYFVGGRLLGAYPVAVGRIDWPTPQGAFQVTGLDRDPVWRVPPSIQEEMRREGRPVVQEVPPGPGNPLGAFRLRLSDPTYSIHGTDDPSSIYHFRSHGCIRLHPDDIAHLFGLVSVGTPVRIVYEPVLLAVLSDGSVFLEVHRDVYGVVPEPDSLAERLVREHVDEQLDSGVVTDVIQEAAGVARLIPVLP
jgi:L,D-transpeptidase ErfK/SrfK